MKDESEVQLCQAFGKNLTKIRKERGYSQERLAHESTLARSYVWNVEHGHKNISLINICKIADALQVDVVELMRFRDIG